MTIEIDDRESWAWTTTWLMLANILRNIGLLLVLLFLTQLTDPETVGRYALALALTTPTFAFAQFGLRGVYLTLRVRLRLSSYLLVQTGGVIAATGVSVALAALVDGALASTVVLVSVFKAADAYCELFSAPLQQCGRSVMVFWGFLTSALFGGVAVGVGLVTTGQLDVAIAGLATVNVVVTVILFALPAARLARGHDVGTPHGEEEGSPRRKGARIVLMAGIPTGLSLSVLALIPTLPQYFLAAYSGTAAVGYFSVVLYIYMAAELFTGTLVQSWLPHARERFESPGREQGDFFRWLLAAITRWTALFVPISVVGFLFAWWVYPIIFSGYALTFDVIVPLATTILLLPTLYFSSAAISVRNLYAHNLTVGVVAALVSLAASALLVPAYGVVGALWAAFAGAVGRTVTATTIVVFAERRSD